MRSCLDVSQKPARATGTPWGHVSSGCIYTGAHEKTALSSLKRTRPTSPSARTTARSIPAPKPWERKSLQRQARQCLPLAPAHPLRQHRQPAQLPHQADALRQPTRSEPTVSHNSDEFVAVTFACWEKHIPFGTYNVTNPGYVTTREVVELIQASGRL